LPPAACSCCLPRAHLGHLMLPHHAAAAGAFTTNQPATAGADVPPLLTPHQPRLPHVQGVICCQSLQTVSSSKCASACGQHWQNSRQEDWEDWEALRGLGGTGRHCRGREPLAGSS
jgi:hypothetical protein